MEHVLPFGVFLTIIQFRPRPEKLTFSSYLEKIKPNLCVGAKQTVESINCLKKIIRGDFWQFRFTLDAQQQFNKEIRAIEQMDRCMGQLILGYVMCILKKITNNSDLTCIASRVFFTKGGLVHMANRLWSVQRQYNNDDTACDRAIMERINNDVEHLYSLANSGII